MITHTEAEAKFKRSRNKERGYLLAKHTRLQKRGRAFAVCLHNTDVVMIRPDGTYRLNSGGWRTTTDQKSDEHGITMLCLAIEWHLVY